MLLGGLAALLYVGGGVAMTFSRGFSRLLPSLLVFACFCAGAALQTLSMRQQELGVCYVIVLGLEAVLASGAGILFLGESPSLPKLAGTALVIAGISLLKLATG